ncbi:MAG: PKD domain-containing protein [Anaerolineales bacterium]|nr:PKD domain-containing protein [Anaerolineales bacterium]
MSYTDDNYNKIYNSFNAPQIEAAMGPNSGGNRQVWGVGARANGWVTVTVRSDSGDFIASTTVQADDRGNYNTGEGLPENSVASTSDPFQFWNQIEVDFDGLVESMTVMPMGIEANPETDVITVTAAGPPFFSVSLNYYYPDGDDNWADLGNIGFGGQIVVDMMAEYGFDVTPGAFFDAHMMVWGDHWLHYNAVVPFLHVKVNQSHNWIEGEATPNNTIVATVWRGGLPVMAGEASNGGGTDWQIQFDNSRDRRLQTGDLVEVTTSDGQSAIVEIIPMTGAVDSAADTINGQLEGVPFPANIRGEVWGIEGVPPVDGSTDGAGNYTIYFDSFDVDPGNMIALWYIQPDGNEVAIVRHGLQLRVDTGEDRIDGTTAASVPVTVTINGGETQTAMSSAEGEFDLYFASDIAGGDIVEAWSGWNTEYVNLEVAIVTAAIDEANDKVYGNGPADSQIQVAVNDDWQETTSDNTGYFEFQYEWDLTSDNYLDIDYNYPQGHVARYGYGPIDLWISKGISIYNIVPGDVFTYSIEYRNDGYGDVADVIITDTLPVSITYLSDTSGVIPTWNAANRTLVWHMGHLASNRGAIFELQVLLDSNVSWNEQLQNVIEINATDDMDPSNNWSQTGIQPNNEQIDLWVMKSVESGQPIAGEIITYQINYGNNGNRPATNVLLTDTLPAGVTYVGTTFDGPFSSSAGQVVFELGELKSGDSGVIELSVAIDIHESAGALLVNETQIACNEDESNPRDNWHRLTTVVEPAVADVWVEKDIWGDLSDINNAFTYHITFGNQGNMPAEDVVIMDTLPVSITQLWHSAGSAVSTSNGVVVWNIGTVAPGASGELLIGVRVDTPVPVGTVLTNTVEISTSTSELDLENNQALAVLGPPKVINAPWSGDRPHRVWSGLDTTLKGTAKGFGLTEYEWDPGDGSPVITGWVNDPYIIEADHTYTGSPGDSFIATLTVWGAFGWSDSDTYLVQVYTQTQGIEADVAVDEGLWYLHKSTDRYQSGGRPFAEWANGGSTVAVNASTIQAFQVHGHRPGGDLMEDPYVEDVQRGWNAMFTYSVLDAMTIEPNGDPDSDSDGVGIGLYADYNHAIYEAGLAMMALATTGTPDRVAYTGPAFFVRGQTYLDIVQDMADWFAWGQNDYDWARGGWRYQPNSGDSDNSNTQFPVLGLAAAEDTWGVTVPSWVKDELRDYWLASTQNVNGAFGYTNDNEMLNVAKAGAGIIDLVWSDVPLDDTRIISAANYIEMHWNDPYDQTNSGGNVGDLYAMYAVKKGSQLAEILTYGPYDWQSIYDAKVISMQNPDGSIDEDSSQGLYFGNWQPMATSWSLLILAPGLYEAIPVPIISPVHYGGLGPAWDDGEIQFDGSLSHHTDPDRIITEYEWDFGDGSPVEFTSSPIVVHTYATRGVYLASLTVWDDAGQSATRATRVYITAPDTPPVADPNGPYFTDPGQGIWLDATGSYDPDAGLGDEIVEYDWDLGDGNSVTTTIPALYYTYTNPGLYQVTLTVRDLGAEFGLDSPQWSDPAITTVGVDFAIAGLWANNDSPTVLGNITTLDAGVTAGTSVEYTWDLGDGLADTGATVQHIYPHIGVFTATVIARNNVGQSDTETVVTIIDEAITGLSATNDGPTALGRKTTLSASITTGSNVVYEWDLGDGNKASGAIVQHKYPAVDTYTAIVTATNSLSQETDTTIVVIEPVADLSILKTDQPDPVIAGQLITYTLYVVNGGPSSATGIILTDTLPVGVTFVSDDGGCIVTGRIVVCNLPDLAAPMPYASTTIHIVVTPNITGTLMNFAEVASNEHDLTQSNNLYIQYTTVVEAPVYDPVVNSITPDSGLNDEATAVTIEGGNFQNGATASLNGTALTGVVFVNGNSLTANVPAGMTPDTYDLTVINPDSRSGILLDAFTVLAPTPPVLLDVSPNQGPNDIPVTIDIYGENLANGLAMTLTLASRRPAEDAANGGVAVESLLFIDTTHVRGLVPVEIAAGMYDLEAVNPDGRSGTLEDAYEAFEAAVYDDLYANFGDLWLNPPSYRQGDAVTPQVGLRLRRQGGEGNLTNVQVSFYKGNPATGGVLIGTGVVPTLAPNSVKVASVDWLPKPTAGSYTLYAVIDPANVVPEEVETNNTINLGVVILPPRADTTPPVVSSFKVNNGAASTSVRQVTFDLAATDLGGSGVKDVKYITFQFIQSVGDWVPIASSGWIPYGTSSVSYPWQLQPEPGIRYIQAWVSDKNGNVTTTPGKAYINLAPELAHVAQSQVWIFRYPMAVGEQMRVRLTSVIGDADLYIWDPAGNLVAFSGLDNPEDVTFTAAIAGKYQIEVEGYTASDFTLEVIPLGSSREPDTVFRGAIQTRGWPYISPDNEPTEQVGMESAPVGDSYIYLPLVLRQ